MPLKFWERIDVNSRFGGACVVPNDEKEEQTDCDLVCRSLDSSLEVASTATQPKDARTCFTFPFLFLFFGGIMIDKFNLFSTT
jgi:hypothetical protein